MGHAFYSQLTDPEVETLKSILHDAGLDEDGQVSYEKLKAFLESQDIETSAGRAPSNLVSGLMSRRMDAWMQKGDLTQLFSPRSWRHKLNITPGGAAPSGGTGKGKKETKKEDAAGSPTGQDEDDGAKGKKDKKDKKEKGDDPKDKKDKK